MDTLWEQGDTFIIRGGLGLVYTVGENLTDEPRFVTGYRHDETGEITSRRVVHVDNIVPAWKGD